MTYNTPYGNDPQQDYGAQQQPEQGWGSPQPAYTQPDQGWGSPQPTYTQPQPQPTYAQPDYLQPQPQQPAYVQPTYQQTAYTQQPTYQQSQPAYTPGYSQQSNDSGSFGWAVLGFFIPLVGLILWLVWKDTKPKSAKMAGIGALVGVGISLLWWLVGMSMLGSMMQYGM
mgnify:FL=1